MISLEQTLFKGIWQRALSLIDSILVLYQKRKFQRLVLSLQIKKVSKKSMNFHIQYSLFLLNLTFKTKFWPTWGNFSAIMYLCIMFHHPQVPTTSKIDRTFSHLEKIRFFWGNFPYFGGKKLLYREFYCQHFSGWTCWIYSSWDVLWQIKTYFDC